MSKLIVTIDIKGLKKMLPDIKEDFSKKAGEPIKQAILKDILRGVSPVRTKRFPKYTKEYRDKKLTVPNLKQTGELLKSLYAKVLHSAHIGHFLEFGFKDKKAEYHNNTGPGGNKAKLRRMLPSNDKEDFNNKIKNLISNLILKSIDRVVKKNR